MQICWIISDESACFCRDDTDEGTGFVVGAAASSPADVASWMTDQYTRLTAQDTDTMNALYPLQAPVPNHPPYFPSLAAAYGEATFVCPGLEISSVFAEHGIESWNYR